jgi:aspartate racemase
MTAEPTVSGGGRIAARDAGTIGVLGGMGPLASAAFLRTIYDLHRGRPEQDTPSVIVYSDPTVPDRTQTFLAGASPDPIVAALNNGLRRLRDAGAGKVVICCVTIHHVLDRVEPELRPLVVSLVDVIADALRDRPGPHVIACTTGTRRMRILQRHPLWPEVGRRARWLDDADQDALHTVIYELKRGAAPEPASAWLAGLAKKYRARGVISACTDLHLLRPVRSDSAARQVAWVDPLTLVAQRLCGLVAADGEACVPSSAADRRAG